VHAEEKKDDNKALVQPAEFAGMELRLPEGRAHEIVLSLDGTKMAVGVAAKISVWNVADGKELTRMQLPAESWNHGLAFSADSKTLLWFSNEDKMARIFDVKTGRQVREFKHHRDNTWPSAFPDASRLVYQTSVHGLEIVDVSTGKRQLHLEKEGNSFTAFARDCKVIASYNAERGARLYDAASGKLIQTLVHDPAKGDSFRYLVFSPDGSRIAAWGRIDKALDIWDVKTGTRSIRLRPRETYHTVHFTRTNKSLLAVVVWRDTILYDIAQDKHVHSFYPPTQPNFAALSRDEKKVLILGPSSGHKNSGRQHYSIFVHDVPAEAKKLGLGSK
jgi:WD40 repeat protein